MKKYELTENTKEYCGHALYQIRALIDFGDVEAGELGGWIESETNLSQEGMYWVYKEAIVFQKARVSGEAKVYGGAEVYGNVRVSGNTEVSGAAEVYNSKGELIHEAFELIMDIIDSTLKYPYEN